MEGRLLLNVIIRERPAVFKLLAGEDETLLVRGDTLLVLDLAFDVVNGITRLDFEGDCLASECLYENLHPSKQPGHYVESRLVSNVVIGQRAAVLELLARENEALLVRRNPFLVLYFTPDLFDHVRAFHIAEDDGFARDCLNEDLHVDDEEYGVDRQMVVVGFQQVTSVFVNGGVALIRRSLTQESDSRTKKLQEWWN